LRAFSLEGASSLGFQSLEEEEGFVLWLTPSAELPKYLNEATSELSRSDEEDRR